MPSSKYARRYHVAIPGLRLDGAVQRLVRACPASARARVTARARAIGAKRRRTAIRNQREPDALALALVADQVHAVVPVAAAHQRQPVRA